MIFTHQYNTASALYPIGIGVLLEIPTAITLSKRDGQNHTFSEM